MPERFVSLARPSCAVLPGCVFPLPDRPSSHPMESERRGSDSAEPYTYVNLGGPEQETEEFAGCFDMVVATSGMGCALAARGVLLLAVLGILYLLLTLAGFGSGTQNPIQGHGGSGHILRQGLDWWTLALPYFFYLEEQFRRRVVDQLHTGIHLLQ